MSTSPNNPPENPFATPVQQQGQYQAQPTINPNAQGDATGGLIPYMNPHALIAYYLGILAFLPVIGLPFGIASFVLGIIGLRNRKRNPIIKGSAHAIIGIIGGVFSFLCGGVVLVSVILSRMS